MAAERYIFGDFTLDAEQRALSEGGRAISLNARYFDALLLMLRHPGDLIDKDRFNEEVWHAVPVTDEALTQCIRTLRRALRDKAANPDFIETVPRHGYRFIGEVSTDVAPAPKTLAAERTLPTQHDPFGVPLLGAAGGAAAGLVGGVLYGLIALPDGSGALSALLVLVLICVAIGAVAGLGVGLGIWLSERWAGGRSIWTIAGAALGGAAIGALVKLIGLDAFMLILGRGPAAIAGAGEGAVLGAVIGAALFVARRKRADTALALAAIAGLASGAAIAFAGGRLMAGSLDLLARSFDGTGFRLDRIGTMIGEDEFGPLSLAFTTAFEAMLFTVCVVAAIRQPRRTTTNGV